MVKWTKIEKILQEYAGQSLSLAELLYHLYWEQRMSLREIAKLTKNECSVFSIYMMMKKLGLLLRKRGGPTKMERAIPREEFDLYTLKELASQYDVSVSTIKRWRKKHHSR